MVIVPLILLAALAVVVFVATAMKKKGTMSESAYGTLISVCSVIVTIAALVVLFVRVRG